MRSQDRKMAQALNLNNLCQSSLRCLAWRRRTTLRYIRVLGIRGHQRRYSTRPAV